MQSGHNGHGDRLAIAPSQGNALNFQTSQGNIISCSYQDIPLLVLFAQ